MVLMIPEEGSFSLSAYATSPGYQSLVLRGYLVERRNGETWVAPLIPQLFYGVTGAQLGPTWRQYLPAAGEQVVLSRVGGKPEVPREELYWRKVADEEVRVMEAAPLAEEIPWTWIAAGLVFLGIVSTAAYVAWGQG